MVCETLTCCTSSSVGPPSRPARDNLSWRSLYSPLIAFPAMARPPHLTGGVRDQLPACEMVLDIVGDLFTHGRQHKHLVFDGRIVSLLGKLPIHGCLVPEIVRPVHAVHSMSRVAIANAGQKDSPCPPKARQYQTSLVKKGEVKPHRATYDDGIQPRHSVLPLHLKTSPQGR
jgi:hypothetical protein